METMFSYELVVGTAISHPYSPFPNCFFDIKVAVGLTLTVFHCSTAHQKLITDHQLAVHVLRPR